MARETLETLTVGKLQICFRYAEATGLRSVTVLDWNGDEIDYDHITTYEAVGLADFFREATK
jgi:hypothetical protein